MVVSQQPQYLAVALGLCDLLDANRWAIVTTWQREECVYICTCIYMCIHAYMYIVCCTIHMSFHVSMCTTPQEQVMYMLYNVMLGVLCCFALFVCLFDLACFFFHPCHLSFKTCIVYCVHVLMRDEKEERKKQARSNKQTNKAKQHSIPKAVTFPKKNELPQVGLEPTTLYTLYSRQSALPLSYRGSSAGWAKISHLIVHLMNRLTINSV